MYDTLTNKKSQIRSWSSKYHDSKIRVKYRVHCAQNGKLTSGSKTYLIYEKKTSLHRYCDWNQFRILHYWIFINNVHSRSCLQNGTGDLHKQISQVEHKGKYRVHCTQNGELTRPSKTYLIYEKKTSLHSYCTETDLAFSITEYASRTLIFECFKKKGIQDVHNKSEKNIFIV